MIARHHKLGLTFVLACVVIGVVMALTPGIQLAPSAVPSPQAEQSADARQLDDGHSDLILDFPVERQDRRTLPNGTEFFGLSGTITNVGSANRPVPPLVIQLKDGQEREVYSWEVTSTKSELTPGESTTVNEAITDVPPSAKTAVIAFKQS